MAGHDCCSATWLRDAGNRLSGFGWRRRLVEQRHAGPGAARNVGILAARAPLIAFCDADDLWHPDKLARQQAALAEQPDAVEFFQSRKYWPADGLTGAR